MSASTTKFFKLSVRSKDNFLSPLPQSQKKHTIDFHRFIKIILAENLQIKRYSAINAAFWYFDIYGADRHTAEKNFCLYYQVHNIHILKNLCSVGSRFCFKFTIFRDIFNVSATNFYVIFGIFAAYCVTLPLNWGEGVDLDPLPTYTSNYVYRRKFHVF